jgi:hypothetical protein
MTTVLGPHRESDLDERVDVLHGLRVEVCRQMPNPPPHHTVVQVGDACNQWSLVGAIGIAASCRSQRERKPTALERVQLEG